MSCGADSKMLSEMDISEALDLIEDTKYLFCRLVVSILQSPMSNLKLLEKKIVKKMRLIDGKSHAASTLLTAIVVGDEDYQKNHSQIS